MRLNLGAAAFGDVDIYVTAGGSITVTLDGGGVYAAIVHDSVGAVVPLGGLILLDDF